MPIKNVVAQHQSAGGITQKLFADDESLGQAIGARLHSVLQTHAPLAAVAQQLLKAGGILRRADDQHLAYAGQHEGAERVIDHRLVIDRQQLLADGQRGRVQAGAGAASKDDAFAGKWRRVRRQDGVRHKEFIFTQAG